MENQKDNVSKLYHGLIKKGYTQEELGDEAKFRTRMSDSDNRKMFYEYVSNRGDFVIGDYDTYESRLTSSYEADKSKENPQYRMAEVASGGALPTLDGQVNPSGAQKFGKPGFVQDEATALFPMSGTSVAERLSSPLILDEDNNIRAVREAEEDARLDRTYPLGKMETAEDVYKNYASRFTNTQRGIELDAELAKAQDELIKKYLKEFENSAEYKQYAGKKYRTQAEADEANKAINELFLAKYGEAINEGMKPYQKAYNEDLNRRYGAHMEEAIQKWLQRPITTFGEAFEQGMDALYQGGKNLVGEASNIVTGSQRDYQRAKAQLDELVASGYDLSQFDAEQALRAYKDRDFQRKMEAWRQNIASRKAERENMGFFESLLHKMQDPSRPKSQYEETGMFADELQLARSYQAIQDALQKSNGNVQEAYKLLAQSASKETWGDETTREARQALANQRPTEGFGAWVGGMIPQMIGTGVGIVASLNPYTRWLARPLGVANMALLTGSTSGMSMAEARKYAEEKGVPMNEGEIWRTGLVDAAIEYGTEKIPFNRYFGRIQNAAKKIIGKEVADAALSNDAVQDEVSALLQRASSEFRNGLFTKENLKEYLKDVGTEGVSEFMAEALQTLSPIIYQNPEDYPTLVEVLNNGLEGAKGGLFMGAFLGAGSLYSSNRMQNYENRKRREKQGFVSFVETDKGIFEVTGKKDGLFSVMDSNGEQSEVAADQVRGQVSVSLEEFEASMKEAREIHIQDAVEAENAEIDAATDPQTGMYGEVNLTSEDLDGNNIVTPANVFGEKEVNGELYLLVQPEGETEKKWVRPNQYDVNSYKKLPAEQVKAINEEMIREEAAAQAERESKYAPEVLNAQMQLDVPFETADAVYTPVSAKPEGDGWVVLVQPKDAEGKVASQPFTRELTNDEYHDMLQAQLEAQEAAATPMSPMESQASTPMSPMFTSMSEGVAAEQQAAQPKQPTLEEVVATLPKNKKGEIDYKAMTPQQQFQYTSLTESPEVALEDLQADIAAGQKEIEKVQEQLAKANGGQRAELRDKVRQLTAAQAELQSFYDSVTPKEEAASEEVVEEAPVSEKAEESTLEEKQPIVAEEQAVGTTENQRVEEQAEVDDNVTKTEGEASQGGSSEEVADKQARIAGVAESLVEKLGAFNENTAAAYAEEFSSHFEWKNSVEALKDAKAFTTYLIDHHFEKGFTTGVVPFFDEVSRIARGENGTIDAKEESRRKPLRERANEWSKALGVDVTIYESVDDIKDEAIRQQVVAIHNSKRFAPGWVTDGKVYFLMSDMADLDEIDNTYIHEVVAHVGVEKLLGKERFAVLCDKVWEMMPQAAKDYYYNYPEVSNIEDETKRRRKAADEYIAHLAEKQNLTPEEKTIWDNIVKAFRELLDKALNGIISKSKLTDADIAELIKASYANLKSGAEGGEVNNEGSRMRAVERLEENVGEVDAEKGDVRFAVRDVLKGEERAQAIKDLMAVTGRSKRTVEKWLKAEESLASVILNEDNVGILDMEADESVPSIWKNSDYPQGTVEFSNICKKRLPFTTIYQRLQKEFPDTLFDAQTLNTIRNTMKEMGEDVACALCFVEDRRQLLGEIGQGFIDAVKGMDVEVNDNQKVALDKLRESGDKYVPNLFDIITLDGMKELRKKHPAVAQAFIEYNNARGMQSGRLFQAYSAYNREILKYNKKKVESINNNGGLRIFSFSDFEAHHLIDLVQVLTDCAAKGIKVQGYTKVPEFAKAVKDTNAKINRSLIPKGIGYVDADYVPNEGEAVSPNVINGKRLLFDTIEGIDVNNPNFFDSTGSKSVGNILVAINDEHARLAMADPFVDYIIGFHTGQSKAILKGKGIDTWVNYKNEQLDKEVVTDEKGNQKLKNAPHHGLNIYTDVLNVAEAEGNPIKTAKQFTERFLEECAKRGYVPRFSRFLNRAKDGRFLYTPGYHKFLIDFKLFDKNGRILPQEAVVPKFDNAFNKQILDDYVKGVKEEMPNDAVYEAVKEAIGLGEGVKPEGNTRFRFIGERGARNLDKAEEATTRLDNLAAAREMEAAAKDAKAIKMATGWERGADGLWRYETDDLKIKNLDILKESESVLLSDIVEDASLFDAYPQMKDIVVNTNTKNGDSASYVPGIISVSKDSLELSGAFIQSIIAHEIQHAIQNIEGFAGSKSSPNSSWFEKARELYNRGREILLKDYSVEELKNLYKDSNDVIDKELYRDFYVDRRSGASMRDIRESFESAYGNLDAKEEQATREYIRSGGEVEARNVQSRMNLTSEERRKALASETEDVAREDQTFLTNALSEGTRFSVKPIGEGYFGSIYDQFKGNVQGAVDFFEEYQEGDLLGVFSRDGFGEIDAVWGDEGGGVAHIIQKHVGEGKSFKSLSEAFEVISDLIANGKDDYNKTDKAVFKIGSRLVTVRKNIRENGKKIADKNWILTAYDENAGDNTSAISGVNQGQAAPTPAISADKDTANNSDMQEGRTSFRVVTDKNLIDKLESEPKIKVYRAMQLIDGKLYPPMSTKVDGKMREPIELGKWEMAEERPDLADEKGYFKLDKGNKSSLKARYNPYIHTSTTPLNDQFSSAQSRPELVTVEVEIPKSELTSGYKAEKAKDAVGKVEWKAGVVQGKLSGTRTVILSRYDKPIRIVPDSEVADEIVKMFDGKDITMPSNVVTPSLRAELEKRGVPFVETDNQGRAVGTRFRVTKREAEKTIRDFEGMVNVHPQFNVVNSDSDIDDLPTDKWTKARLKEKSKDSTETGVTIYEDDLVVIFGENVKDLEELNDVLSHESAHYVSRKFGIEDVYKASALGYVQKHYPDEYAKIVDRYIKEKHPEEAVAVLFEKKSKEIGLKKLLSATFDTKNDIGYLFNQLTQYLNNGKGISGHRKGVSDKRDSGAEAAQTPTNGQRSEVAGGVRGTLEGSESEQGERRARKERLGKLFDQVADMGLDGVLGNKEYTTAMVDIFKAMPEGVRSDIADRALMYYGGSVAPAVSDYLNKQAKADLWDKVVAIVREALRKVGINLDLNGNEVKYILWRSQKKLDRNSLLEVAEDIDMKYRLKVGEYDGSPTPDGGGTRFSVKPKTKAELKEEIRDLKEDVRGLKDEVKDLRKQVNDLRSGNKDEWEKKQRAIISFIKGRLTKEAGSVLGKTRLEQLLTLVNKASTATDLHKPLQFIEQVINDASIEHAAAKMDKLIKTKLQGETNRGVAKGVVVDEPTRRLFDSIRGTFKELIATSIDSELRSVRGEILRFGKEINALPEDDIQGRAILTARQNALKERRKELEEEKEELQRQNIAETKEYLERRHDDLVEAMDAHIEGKGIWTQEMQDEYDSIPLRLKLVEIREAQAQLDAIMADAIITRRNAYQTTGETRKKMLAEADIIESNYSIAQEELIRLMNEVSDELNAIIKEGKSRLAIRRQALAERRRAIVTMGISAVKDKKIKDPNAILTKKEKFEKWFDNSWLKSVSDFMTAPLNSFNFMLKYIDRNHTIGEGELYNHFMKSKDGALEANNQLYEGLKAYNTAIEEKAKEIFGKSIEKVMKDSGKEHVGEVHKQYMYDSSSHKEGEMYPISITKGQAFYVWLTWRQDDGRTKLLADGWNDQSIEEIEALIGEDYMKFGEWITDEFFPMLREEKYNKTHIEMFGTSMAKREHYFPFKVQSEDIQEKGEMGESYSGMPSTITGNIIKRTINKSRIKTDQNAFDLLYKYGNDMETWNAMAKLRQDLNFLHSSKAFRNYLEANSKGLFDKFMRAAEVAVKAYNNSGESNAINDFLVKFNRMWAGSNIGFRLNTAMKQILSYPAFMAYSGNPKFQLNLGKYMLNWKGNYDWAKENLPAFRQRIETGDMGMTGMTDPQFDFVKYIKKFTDAGMIPNQLVDALTCAAGARSVYDFEYNRAIKAGMSEEEAKNIAQYNAEVAFNETQQSSRDEFVSPTQVSRNVLIKSMMNYQNSNVGYQRMGNEGLLEIIRAKHVYEQDIKSGMSEEEAKKKKVNSILRGTRKMTVAFAVLPGLWYLGGRGIVGITAPLISSLFGGGGDDEPYLDDEAKEELILSIVLGTVAGTSGGQAIASVVQGREYEPMAYVKEFTKIITDAVKDGFNLNTTKNIALKLAKFGGVNVETFENIYLGVENAIRTGNFDLVDFMFLINLPASQRKAMAEELYSNMPFMEYAEKLSRAQKLFDDYRKNLPYAKTDKNGSKKNAIKKQYVIENLSKDKQDKLEKEKEFKKLRREYGYAEDKEEWLEDHPEYKELETNFKSQEVTKEVNRKAKELK